MCKVQLVNTRIQFSTLEFAHVWPSDTSAKYNIIVFCIFLDIFTLHPSSCVFHISINIFLNWNNFIFRQEKRIEEERIKMQKDFEQEQEKSRRKEEEVKCSIST